MKLPLVLAILAAAYSPSFADVLGIEWADRVTHEVEKEDGPPSARPLDFHLYGGVYGYFTDNLFLTNNKLADADWAAIGFARARVDYADSRLEISADVLANFNYYMEHHEGREDEEHAYGKIRYTDGVIDAEIVEIARRETDVLDGIFAEKARRIVTDTQLRFGVKIADLVRAEAFATIETVHFEGSAFDGRENENYRGGVAVMVDVSKMISVGAEGGYLRIHYRRSDLTPNSDGWFARAKMRGDLFDGLSVEVSAGWTRIHAFHHEAGDDHIQKNSTLDAEVNLRYQVTDSILFQADYTRRFGFAGFGNSYQTIDRWLLLAEWEVIKNVKLRARGQYDKVDPSQAPIHTYWYAGVGGTWQVIKNVAIDGGVTYRGGNQHGLAGDDFDNWIFSLGVVVGF